MYLPDVYVGLGGNIGDSCAILLKAIQEIAELPGVSDLAVSRFYCTTPVSSIPQDPYINAVCRFKTNFTAKEVLHQLQAIEKALGKKEKLKEAPRIIDLDILFFGLEVHDEADLQIPHPRWSERLFVIAPLADLTSCLWVPNGNHPGEKTRVDLQKYLQQFPNIHQETVYPISEILRKLCKTYDLKNSQLARASL